MLSNRILSMILPNRKIRNHLVAMFLLLEDLEGLNYLHDQCYLR